MKYVSDPTSLFIVIEWLDSKHLGSNQIFILFYISLLYFYNTIVYCIDVLIKEGVDLEEKI